MKTFAQLKQQIMEATGELEASTVPTDISVIDSLTEEEQKQLDEATVVLKPHGNRGTHFKVVKGVPGHLEKGEVIHDSHVDDLHDMGYTVKHVNEDFEDESGLMSEADWRIGAAADKPLTDEEEKQIARGQRHGDYKGHRAAMKKKHNID